MFVHDKLNIIARFIKSEGVLSFVQQLWRRPLYKRKGFPLVLQIEPTEACNLRCPYCVASQKTLSGKHTLAFSDFKRLLDDVLSVPHYYPNLQLFWRGEPLVNPDFCKMLRYASGKGLHVLANTNATILHAAMRQELLDSGVNMLVFSFDGATKATYEQSRVGANFERVVENVTALCREKAAQGLRKPFVEIQYILTKQTEAEVEQMKVLARKMGVDNLRFKTLNLVQLAREDMPSEQLVAAAREQLPENSAFSRYTIGDSDVFVKSAPKQCAWKHGAVIAANGDLGICCVDSFLKYRLGNVLEEGFWQVWRNPASVKLRERAGTRQLTLCDKCS